MATTGSTRDYRNGIKNNWRRSVWNEALRRTNGTEKHFPVLYMPGSEDLDRPVAEAKGVPRQNLIAVDRDRQNVHRLRSHGLPAIRGDVFEALWAWPSSVRLSAVFIDLCCGLVGKVARDRNVFWLHPSVSGAVIVMNFLRGRDAWSSSHFHGLEHVAHAVQPGLSGKHRGFIWLFLSSINLIGDESRRHSEEDVLISDPAYTESASLVINSIYAPTFFSYRSGPQIFDSVVFQSRVPSQLEGRFKAEDMQEGLERIPAMRRRVAAALAIRTGRIRSSSPWFGSLVS